ncbi:MAG: SRPBCC domain-containing protein [Verrucomicrobia bacterium]|nr:SRPBCC domain-containing protein [Verrucomicrobiota bacterium]
MNQPTNQVPAICLTRVVPGSQERVFAAWTTPEAVKAWFGPGDCEVVDARIDLRVGGKYSIVLATERLGQFSVSGQYKEVQPPEKLVYTWRWEGSGELTDATSLVTVEFVDAGSGTEVRLTHEQLPSLESRDNHSLGWKAALDNFVKYVAS